MNDNISDKDKKDWHKFINNTEKLPNKDFKYHKNKNLKTRAIDLHGYTLDEANKTIEGFINKAFSETKQAIEKKEKDINQKLNEKVVKAEKQIMDTQKLVINEIINNAEELTAKVIQNLTDLKYDKIEGKKAISTASKNILMEK